ncbi:restriction endonuclease subunit S [Phascolarctobacterium succinatutens]|uniref:restriction endonuclease subunit S n=1 Tax=Phascolarctobacterium succinatutens TaxID=626940 RepID=UPI0026EB5443|nr:restriction endonuclease subunit S [Phascolarctobacterium succinatutens]
MIWEKVKLEDLCVSITDGDHQSLPLSEKGIPFIVIADINRINRIEFDKARYVPVDYYKNLDKKRKPQKGDVLLTVKGSFGIPVYVDTDNPFVFQRDIAIMKCNEKINSMFLFYYMKTREFYLYADAVAIGAAQRAITLKTLKNTVITLPSLVYQNRIAELLVPYDKLIENNQKQIKLLEEAAQRLYKEWFVDLHFPGYEDVEVVYGVPEGWRKANLPEIAPIVTGKKDANFGTVNGKYLFFTCAQEPIKAPSYSFDCNAVILAGNGDFNVKLYRGQFEAYQRTYVFSPYNSKRLYLLYYAVKESMRQLFQGASGSTIKFLTKRMLEEILVFVPDKEVLDLFNQNCELFQSKIEALKAQITLAQEARDRLLPKLMSGEIEV